MFVSGVVADPAVQSVTCFPLHTAVGEADCESHESQQVVGAELQTPTQVIQVSFLLLAAANIRNEIMMDDIEVKQRDGWRVQPISPSPTMLADGTWFQTGNKIVSVILCCSDRLLFVHQFIFIILFLSIIF